MKRLKYLSILLLPITVCISFTSTGWIAFIPMIVFFGFVATLELLFSPDKENFNKEQIEKENKIYYSSNMQLWEFYHITSKETIQKITPFCFNQNAARAAQELVVFVARKDLWRKRAKANLAMVDSVFPPKPKSEQSKREKVSRNYYGKLIPFAYADFFGILGFFKYIMILVIGLFKPIYREVRKSDMRDQNERLYCD